MRAFPGTHACNSDDDDDDDDDDDGDDWKPFNQIRIGK